MVRKRDSQRRRVYAAEALAWSRYDSGLTRQMTASAAKQLVDRYCRRLPAHRRIRVEAGDRRGRCCAGWDVRGYYIRLNKPYHKMLVVHELAHHMARIGEGHGGRFVSCYIKLTRRFVGPIEAEVLKRSFLEHRVRVRGGAARASK